MKKYLCLWLVGGLLCLAAWSDPLQEDRDNQRWAQEVRRYAETQQPEVQHAMHMILQDAAALAKLDPHKAHDALQAVLAKIDRARVAPEGAVARERLDSPVGNFGEVVPGQLYRGAQPSPQALRWLKEQGVGVVVILREPGVEETNYPGYSRADYLIDIRTLGMEAVEMPIKDHTVPTPTQIEHFLVTVGKTTRPCFFHCSAGVGRTGILAGIYQREHGMDAQQAVDVSKRFQLSPSNTPDHALQASLLANYPLPGHDETLDLPWGIPGQPNPLTLALARGRGWLVDPRSRLQLDLNSPAPALTRLADSLRSGDFVRLEFRSPEEIDMLASLARVLPRQQKMGFVELQEGGLQMPDLERARHLLGPVPFEVRLHGLALKDLTSERVQQLADRFADKAEVLDLNLAEGENPTPQVLKQLAERGIGCTVHFTKTAPRAYWDALEIGYFALSAPDQ